MKPVSRGARLLAAAVALAVVAACGESDTSQDSTAPSVAEPETSSEVEAAPGDERLVQDMWMYHRVVTVGDSGAEVDLTEDILALLESDPETVPIGETLLFHRSDDVAARVVDADGEERRDVDAEVGVLEVDDDRILTVVATPGPDAERPIGDTDRVQLELTELGDDVLAPGDPLIMDVAFAQAYGAGEGDGAELFADRATQGRMNFVGADVDGVSQLAVTTEIGSAVDGSTWSDMPPKSNRMMDGFGKGFEGCRFGIRCVKNYFQEMVDVAVDFSIAFDCNMGFGPCLPPPPDPPRDPPPTVPERVAKVHGDPHLMTFDGFHYAMHAVGEFVAARNDDIDVHIRTAPAAGRDDVSLLAGVAVRVADHEVSMTDDGFFVDGEAAEPTAGAELDGAVLSGRGNGFELVTDSGISIAVTSVGNSFEMWVSLPAEDSRSFVGLLGNNNGDTDDEIVTRDGRSMNVYDFAEFYGEFVDSWRLDDDESAFHYRGNESTATFTDTSLPRITMTLDSVPDADRERAEAVCRSAGIADGPTLEQCTLDYALTGDVGFVRSAATMYVVLGVVEGRLTLDGADVGADDRAEPGDAVEFPWAATASTVRDGDDEYTRVLCPPDGTAFTVWGTDVYTDDSSVCTAAVHIGLIDFDDGGEVLIEHRPGQESYRGTEANGVSTRDWDQWPGSFVFVGATGLPIETGTGT